MLLIIIIVEKNGNEHFLREERFICLCCGIENLLFAVHIQSWSINTSLPTSVAANFLLSATY